VTNKIVFTGGGTAGHVTPNIALLHRLQALGWQCSYIGSKNGIEQQLMGSESIPYFSISSGKLRRYFSLQNFIDPLKISFGILQAYYHLSKIKPDLVFSKGGFVSFPVVVAAWLKRIPVIAHESDITPGLTTKLSVPFAKHICVTFAKGKQYFKHQEKVVITGTPIRRSLFEGDKDKAWHLCRFQDPHKPCLLIIGGGLGAMPINNVIHQNIQQLVEQYNIIHLCGKGKTQPQIELVGYCQFEYVQAELADLFALADLVISRSGANSVYEILSLEKPHIFVPLPLKVSRGDQIQNAKYFHELGVSYVLEEEKLSLTSLLEAIENVFNHKEERLQKLKSLQLGSGTENIIKLVKEVAA
jgi:UDP-N-acetylglucosamine--N-acetylmuramyl-(pentapeptide) pyrophosphoryl-undecaprenol N-acetylglucosamine transferase